MATNTTAIKKRRKLVFDIQITLNPSSTGFTKFVLCTVPTSYGLFSRTSGIQGDRHSSLLQDYQALTASGSYSSRQQRQVRAWFVPSSFEDNVGMTSAPAAISPFIQFVDQSNNTNPPLVPPLDVVVTENGFSRRIFQGQDATFARLFQVKIRARFAAGTVSGIANTGRLRGQLYVHRLHSIEI